MNKKRSKIFHNFCYLKFLKIELEILYGGFLNDVSAP